MSESYTAELIMNKESEIMLNHGWRSGVQVKDNWDMYKSEMIPFLQTLDISGYDVSVLEDENYHTAVKLIRDEFGIRPLAESWGFKDFDEIVASESKATEEDPTIEQAMSVLNAHPQGLEPWEWNDLVKDTYNLEDIGGSINLHLDELEAQGLAEWNQDKGKWRSKTIFNYESKSSERELTPYDDWWIEGIIGSEDPFKIDWTIPDPTGMTKDEFGNPVKSHPSQYTIGGMDFAEKELRRNRGDVDDDILDNPIFNFEALQKKYSMCNSCMENALEKLSR